MSDPDVVSALEALGYNKNEGRAYASLLSRGPSTGYEVSQHANIPRSAVYSVLRTLVSDGAARSTPGPPERFTATRPEALTAQLKKRFDTSSQVFRDAADKLGVGESAPDAHSVSGYQRILEEATSLIQGAERTLVASGWPRELSALSVEIAAAHKRGVFVVLFSHASLPSELMGTHYSYGLAEAELESFWRHRLVLVADDKRSLLGATEEAPEDRAVISDTVAIAEIAVSQIALDITLLSQRTHHDAGPVLAKILGDRIGRLDTLVPSPGSVEVGEVHDAKGASNSKKPATAPKRKDRPAEPK